MMNDQPRKDLVILVADKNMEFALKGLLPRHETLGMHQLTYDIYVHPEHDPGCLLRSHDYLRIFANAYAHALVIFDREGCGQDESPPQNLESQVEEQLSKNGWNNRALSIVLDPELETWVWSDSPQVDSVLGWQGKTPDLRSWLNNQGFLSAQRIKPDRPKEALELALKLVRKPRSSALYFQLAQGVNFDRCSDPAFIKLKTTLKNWFAENP